MKRIYLFVILVIILTGCEKKPVNYIEINDNIIEVELAKTPEEQRIGLMYRESLEDNEGMFFIFENEGKKTFWMKNTLIPLDIIFINSSNRIVDIVTMQPCKTDPCEAYTSKEPSLYVLEVNAGFAKENNINIGEFVKI